jgi:hypothetical protein
MDVFDNITVLSEKTLDQSFIQQHAGFVRLNKRGFGYWLWKASSRDCMICLLWRVPRHFPRINPCHLDAPSQPFVIWKTLESLSDGDVLAYIDIGCSFNQLARPRLLKYFNIVSSFPNGLLAFQLAHQVKQMWTKMDTSFFLGCNATWCFEEKQVLAGISFWKNTAKNRKFAREWYENGFSNNYTHITDSPSILPNHPTFKEHRHDQSIFSIMCRQRLHEDGDVLLLPDETSFISGGDSREALAAPIWATRLKF